MRRARPTGGRRGEQVRRDTGEGGGTMATAVFHPTLAPAPACGSLGDPAAGTQRHGCSGTPGGGGAGAAAACAGCGDTPEAPRVRGQQQPRPTPCARGHPPAKTGWAPLAPRAAGDGPMGSPSPPDPRTVVDRRPRGRRGGGAVATLHFASVSCDRGAPSTAADPIGHRDETAAAAAAAASDVDTRRSTPRATSVPAVSPAGTVRWRGMTVRWRGGRHPAQPLSGGPTPPPTGAERVTRSSSA